MRAAFQRRDVIKQCTSSREKSETNNDRTRTAPAMGDYAETRECRRSTLLHYFGEQYAEPSCGGCDNCLTPRETIDGTIPAQKFLSCVHRVHAKSGFGFGLNHIVDVLMGGDTAGIRQRGHDQLSTYGIGRELKRNAWQAIGRELLRVGLVECAPGKFATLN
jgi:ATP-dependent DNA helicase RecQ